VASMGDKQPDLKPQTFPGESQKANPETFEIEFHSNYVPWRITAS